MHLDLRKLAIITTHPIQYNAPLFQELTRRNLIRIKVFYTWGQTKEGPVYDPTFKMAFQWDIPVLEGYDYEFVSNESSEPGSHHFKGIINKQLIGKVGEWQPDAILVYGWSFDSHLKALRYFKNKIPVFFRGDSTLLDEMPGFSLKKMVRRIFLRWVYHHIDKALYTGEANKKYFLAHGVNSDKLEYAPHAIDNKRFQNNEEESINKALEWRKKLNIPVDAIILLFAGKLELKKNPQLLLEVFMELDNPTVHLVIAGNGELESQLKQQSANHSKVHFIGFQNQEQMPVVYRMADIYILPSGGPGETWGLAINEAMACARPVIVSDACGGSQDLVVQDKNGIIVQRNNKTDLKKAIQQLMAREKKGIQAMGKNSLEHIQHFSLESVSEVIENALLRN